MAELTYTVKEAAEALGVCINTMYQLVHRAGFPAQRIGARKWVISKAGLANWMEKQTETVPESVCCVREVRAWPTTESVRIVASIWIRAKDAIAGRGNGQRS